MVRRYLQAILSISLLFVIFPFSVALADPGVGRVVINEIQTGGAGTGTTGQEFVELTNIGAEPTDLTGYRLQYTPSTGNLASTKNFVTFSSGTVIYPGGYLLVSASDYLSDISPKVTYVINNSFSGLSGSGATVSLVDSIGVLLDRVGYGTTTTILREVDLALAPAGGESIERTVASGAVIDSDNNKNDFIVNNIPTPQVTNEAPIIAPEELVPAPAVDPVIPPVSEEVVVPEPTNTDLLPLVTEPPLAEPTSVTDVINDQPILLNELFIDPDSPLTDANDEWVELYNPSDSTIDISGYTLYTGTNYTYHYTFLAGSSIAPHGYLSVTSGNTPIALANGGGAAKIVSPNGEVFDQITYDSAKPGQAWAKDVTGIWQWTTTPSQDSQNVITVAAADPIKAAVASMAAAKKPKTAAVTSTARPKAAAAAKPKATAKPKSGTNSNTIPGLVDAPMPIPVWLLAVFGSLAILYAAYEYRFELSNKLFQLRAYRANRRANRPATSWWRSDSAGE